jgi:hypothetical protein
VVGDTEILTVDGGGAGGVSDIVAVAVLVGSATLVAVSMIVCAVVIEAGAVYSPFFKVPATGAMDQVTPALVVPLIAALNCCA